MVKPLLRISLTGCAKIVEPDVTLAYKWHLRVERLLRKGNDGPRNRHLLYYGDNYES